MKLTLSCLNHISRVTSDVEATKAFYRDLLGFTEIKRPAAFEFEGSWLYGYNLGIHLISGTPVPRSSEINPMADHLSFQAESLGNVEEKLKSLGVKYVKSLVPEGNLLVTQLFFHDPDRNMIEVCDCHFLPIVALDAGDHCFPCKLPHTSSFQPMQGEDRTASQDSEESMFTISAYPSRNASSDSS